MVKFDHFPSNFKRLKEIRSKESWLSLNHLGLGANAGMKQPKLICHEGMWHQRKHKCNSWCAGLQCDRKKMDFISAEHHRRPTPFFCNRQPNRTFLDPIFCWFTGCFDAFTVSNVLKLTQSWFNTAPLPQVWHWNTVVVFFHLLLRLRRRRRFHACQTELTINQCCLPNHKLN